MSRAGGSASTLVKRKDTEASNKKNRAEDATHQKEEIEGNTA